MKSFQNAFQDEKHRAYILHGGRPGALLVHGFPGTPAEMRPIGEALHQAGWTVEGLLLPGFGAELDTLFERDHDEWADAIAQALTRLQADHTPVMLIGYSMGASLALRVAHEAATSPDALVMIAPFLKLGNRWQNFVGAIFSVFMSSVRPFKDADFSDPQLRHSLSNFFPNADLDDPAMQQEIRKLEVPLKLFEHLSHIAKTASSLAPKINLPTLIIQGMTDKVAPQPLARDFLAKIPGPLQYVEIDAGHDIIKPENKGWVAFRHAVLAFADKLLMVQTHETQNA